MQLEHLSGKYEEDLNGEEFGLTDSEIQGILGEVEGDYSLSAPQKLSKAIKKINRAAANKARKAVAAQELKSIGSKVSGSHYVIGKDSVKFQTARMPIPAVGSTSLRVPLDTGYSKCIGFAAFLHFHSISSTTDRLSIGLKDDNYVYIDRTHYRLVTPDQNVGNGTDKLFTPVSLRANGNIVTIEAEAASQAVWDVNTLADFVFLLIK